MIDVIVNRTCSTPDHADGVAVSKMIGRWLPTCQIWTNLMAQPSPLTLSSRSNEVITNIKNVGQCSQRCLDHDTCNAFYYSRSSSIGSGSSTTTPNNKIPHQCYLFDSVDLSQWQWTPLDEPQLATTTGIAQVIDRQCARTGDPTPVEPRSNVMPHVDL
jgi:hypothetical protein